MCLEKNDPDCHKDADPPLHNLRWIVETVIQQAKNYMLSTTITEVEKVLEGLSFEIFPVVKHF